MKIVTILFKGVWYLLTAIGLFVTIWQGWLYSKAYFNQVQPDQELMQAGGCLIVEDHNDNGYLMLGVLTHLKNTKDGRRSDQLVFGPPGGGMKKGVDVNVKATAIRETREETGYTVEAIPTPLHVFLNNNTAFSLFECKIDEEKPVSLRDSEAIGVVWADPTCMKTEAWRFPGQQVKITDLYGDLASGSEP